MFYWSAADKEDVKSLPQWHMKERAEGLRGTNRHRFVGCGIGRTRQEHDSFSSRYNLLFFIFRTLSVFSCVHFLSSAFVLYAVCLTFV